MHQTQRRILEAVKVRGVRDFDSLRELGKLIGELHPQKVKHHLLQMEKLGLIHIDWSQNRIELNRPQGNQGIHSIKLLGAANCGEATIFADEQAEGLLMVSDKVLPMPYKENFFALKAIGDSMNKAQVSGGSIEDGDFVVVDPDNISPIDGDYVVSIINGSANIKRFYKDNEHNRIILRSESTEEYPPIFIHFDDSSDFLVNGKVLSVIKQPKIKAT